MVILDYSSPLSAQNILQQQLQAKKHVFCEKPMAVDGTGVRSVMQSAALAKEERYKSYVWFLLAIQPCHYVQRSNNCTTAQSEMIRLVFCNVIMLLLFGLNHAKILGVIWSGKCATGCTYDWLSGDHIVEQACHSIDKINWVISKRSARERHGYSAEGKCTKELKRGNVYDHFGVVYEYADGRRDAGALSPNAVLVTTITTTILLEQRAHALSTGGHGAPVFTGSSELDLRTATPPNMYQVEHNELQASIRGDRTNL